MNKRITAFMMLIFIIITCIPTNVIGDTGEKDSENIKNENNTLTIKVGQYDYPGLIDVDEKGNYSGYAVDYLNKLSEYTGWEYEYVYAPWSELVQKLQNGDIDILCSAQYTPERAEKFEYTKTPLGYENSIIYVRADDDRYYYDDFKAFDGMTIGAMAGNYQNGILDEYAKKKGFNFKFKFFALDSQAFEALDNEDVDAVLTGGMSMRSDYKTVCEFSSDPFYIISNKESKELVSEIDEVMEKVRIADPFYTQELYDKYYGDNIKDTAPSFTREEAEYIESVGTIRVGNQVGRFPLCYQDNDGEIKGIQIDLMNQISKMSGLKFEYEAVQAGQKAVDYIENTGAKLFNGMSLSTVTMFSPKLAMSEPIFFSKIGIVGRKGNLLTQTADVTFALPSNYINGKEVLEKTFPNADFISCDTGEECFKAIVNGEADYSIQDKYICNALLQKPYYEKLSLMEAYQIPQETFIAALNTENPMLLSIINKCIDRIGEKTMTDVVANYTVGSPYQLTFKDYIYKYRIAVIVIVILFMLLMMTILIFYVVRTMAARKIAITNKELEKVNTDLGQAVNKANAGNRAKSDFLAQMSHEMRTPMNAIIGMANLAQDASDCDQKNEYINKISSSGTFLLGIINDILDMSKIENGKFELHPEWIKAEEVMYPCFDMLRPAMEKKNINFIFPERKKEKNEYKYEYYLDPLRSQQVYMNLLNNALKFTPEGGTIEFSIRNLSVNEDEGHDEIVVSDTGCGMSEEFLTKIFEPFEQEENEFTGKVQGTGLGLALVKKIVEAMGGNINVTSKLGEGSTFTFDVRYKFREAKNEIDESKKNVVEIGGKRVLLVDDNELNREIAQKILEKKGILVEVACDGQEAVEAFRKSTLGYYDAILMDIRMPKMNGLVATENIRKSDRPDGATVPIIAMTANAFDDDVKNALDAGMNEHLAKPIEPQLLYKTIAKWINAV